MNSAEVLIKFKGDTTDAEKSTNKMTASIGQLTKSFTLGNLAAKAITKTLDVMTANMDSAIRRVDIMNNFPRVMSNLGISAEDSAEVIKDLSKQLQGLPTTMDSAAQAVQRFTSKNGDVKQSEKLFLAVNNAILAGGASSEIQASAMEQLSQAYAKGKPDMMEWRSLMTAMPAQLKQVATAMGYVDADALGQALRNGSVSMDDFMNTMVKMNTEGTNGFKSFEEQARNATGGIGTSITNMKTAFVRGVANMITKIDEALEPFGGLKGVIQEIGKVGEQAFKKIGDVLAWVIPKIIEIGNWIVKNKEWLIPLTIAVVSFIAAFKTVSTVISIINAAKTAFASLNAVMMANPIGVVIALIAALVAVFIYVWNHCETFRNFWIGLWENIKQVVSMWVDGFKVLINGIVSFFGGIISWFVQAFNTWRLGFNVMKGHIINFVNGVVGVFKAILDLPKKMINIGLDIVKGIGKGITNGVSWLKNRIKEFVGNVTGFIKKMFKIGSPSKLMAQQVGQWLPKGIGVGITANTDSVYDAMDEMQEGIMSTYGLSPQMTNSMGMHYSPNVNVFNNVDVSTDPLGQTVSQIKTFSGGARNDYNYGMGA